MKTGLFLVLSGLAYIGLLVWVILTYMIQDWWLIIVLVSVASIGIWWEYRRKSNKGDTK